MHALTRLHRTTIVGRLAARLYLLYKLPEWGRKLRGRPKATDIISYWPALLHRDKVKTETRVEAV